MGVLDQYDAGLLDDKEYDDSDPDARAAAEAAMHDRDRKEGRFRKSRIAAALESDDGAPLCMMPLLAKKPRRRSPAVLGAAGSISWECSPVP
jgi:hypothetical protein